MVYDTVGTQWVCRTDNVVQSDGADPVTTLITQALVDAWTVTAGAPETDPVYSAAPAAGITAGDITSWAAAAATVTAGETYYFVVDAFIWRFSRGGSNRRIVVGTAPAVAS